LRKEKVLKRRIIGKTRNTATGRGIEALKEKERFNKGGEAKPTID